MLDPSQIVEDVRIYGVKGLNQAVTVVRFKVQGDVYRLDYEDDAGHSNKVILTPDDLASLSLAETWPLDQPPKAFLLAIEAMQLQNAARFNRWSAIATAEIDPLPHQIDVVYGIMLERYPLRFLLADDPGAGKTIMAGLYIRELLMRQPELRVAIIAPGGLCQQWQDELKQKFHLRFSIYNKDCDPNCFQDQRLWILRLDQLARNPDLTDSLLKEHWDLALFDEAHKLSASARSFNSSKQQGKTDYTARFNLGRRVSDAVPQILLMTATPHHGKNDDFVLFLSLLDKQRFDVQQFQQSCSDHVFESGEESIYMRRMVKEDLITFDGKPLFPKRYAYSVDYPLSPQSRALYDAVTDYVRTQMHNLNAMADNRKKNAVGFALTLIQRRLASSPLAISRSLDRRLKKLNEALNEASRQANSERFYDDAQSDLARRIGNPLEQQDDLTEEEQACAEQLSASASAAQTLSALKEEIDVLATLCQQARELIHGQEDEKWLALAQTLDRDEILDPHTGHPHKIIIFSEHLDTIKYLRARLKQKYGGDEGILEITGSTPRQSNRGSNDTGPDGNPAGNGYGIDRIGIQTRFRLDPSAFILLATDAAGEGVNLQCAHLMINYDLPWNPNRLEQRFGRIHRIGQKYPCRLYNLVATDTREGEVFRRLFEKLQRESNELNDQIFNILGELFTDCSLSDLIMKAITEDDAGQSRQIELQFDRLFDTECTQALHARKALVQTPSDPQILSRQLEERDRDQAMALQPYYLCDFLQHAFEAYELGRIEKRGSSPWSIRVRSQALLDRARKLRNQGEDGLRSTCKCVTFDPKEAGDHPDYELIDHGHLLVRSVIAHCLDPRNVQPTQGALLVDPNDESTEPYLCALIESKLNDKDDHIRHVSLAFIRIDEQGQPQRLALAPLHNCRPPTDEEWNECAKLIQAEWVRQILQTRLTDYGDQTFSPEHLRSFRSSHQDYVQKYAECTQNHYDHVIEQIDKLRQQCFETLDKLAPEDPKRANLKAQIEKFSSEKRRMAQHCEEQLLKIHAQLNLRRKPCVLQGAALVVPKGYIDLQRALAQGPEQAEALKVDVARKRIVEQRAMQRVEEWFANQGCQVEDVSSQNLGWDLTIRPQNAHEGSPTLHIEVKGIGPDNNKVTVSRNEQIRAANCADRAYLAIVRVPNLDDPLFDEGPHFTQAFIYQGINKAIESINYDVKELLRDCVTPRFPKS